jgi:hypothetical protein
MFTFSIFLLLLLLLLFFFFIFCLKSIDRSAGPPGATMMTGVQQPRKRCPASAAETPRLLRQ